MRIRRINTTLSGDVRQFIQFPFDLYGDCALWVPPLVSDMKLVLNRQKHPFYRHSSADFFLAEDEGRTMGRIGVFENRSYNQFNQCKAAFFYYFESVQDVNVARALFDAVCGWASERGLTEVIGPKGPGAGDGIGLLVEGFQHRPAMGIPYNYAYYPTLLEECGFEKRGDLLSGYLSGHHELSPRVHDLAEKIRERRGFWVKTFTSKREGRRWIQRIGKALNEAFSDGPDYYPINDEEMEVAGRQLLTVVNPRLIKLVMKGEDIVGFLFAFPDLSEALQRIRGRLWPLGWYHLWREMGRTQWVNINGLGLLPQFRGVGANALLYSELAKTLHEFRFEHADIVQVGEENTKSRAENDALGVQWYKRHRVYIKTMGR